MPTPPGSAAAVRSILSNAREAILGPGSISVSTAAEDTRAVLRIADSGEGMAPELQRRIFMPFVTTKFLGRGLGLASAHATVAAHGGTLDVQSAPSRGTTVTISLPASVHGQA